MIKLWRPRDTDWGNRWPAEQQLNELINEGWEVIAVLPPCDYSLHPTVVLQNKNKFSPLKVADEQLLELVRNAQKAGFTYFCLECYSGFMEKCAH